MDEKNTIQLMLEAKKAKIDQASPKEINEITDNIKKKVANYGYSEKIQNLTEQITNEFLKNKDNEK